MRFREGDIVKVSKTYKDKDRHHELGEGEIITVGEGHYPYHIQWSKTGGTGHWSEDILRLVRRKDAV